MGCGGSKPEATTDAVAVCSFESVRGWFVGPIENLIPDRRVFVPNYSQANSKPGEIEDSKSGKRFNELYKIGKEVS